MIYSISCHIHSRHLIVAIAFLLGYSVSGQITIDGRAILDSSWTREIYVSKIPSLYDMYNSGNHLIIAQTKMDSLGNWSLKIPTPDEPSLIRIQVKKKGDPITSLIIGTQDENHGFLGLKGNKDLIYLNTEGRIFANFNTTNSLLNSQLKIIDSVSKHWEKLDSESSSQEEKLVFRKTAAEELLFIADTTSSILPAIFAAHSADFGFNKEAVTLKMNEIKYRLGEHPYLLPYPMKQSGNRNLFLIIAAILLSSILLLRFYKLYKTNKGKKLYNSLSYREREVLDLVVSGKTNKEIGDVLHIEISTVKSHVKNMFAKLEVKSRKQLSKYTDITSNANKNY